LFLSAKTLLNQDVDEQLATLAEEPAEIDAYARRGELSTKGWQPNKQAKDLAVEHGRIGRYVDMRLTDHFVHGSTKATSERFTTEGDTIVIGAAGESLAVWANPTGLFAVHSSLCATRAACLIFGWTEPPELEILMTELAEARAAEDARARAEQDPS
jgi:hypothetical protein